MNFKQYIKKQELSIDEIVVTTLQGATEVTGYSPLGLPIVQQKRVDIRGVPVIAHYEDDFKVIQVGEDFFNLAKKQRMRVISHEEGHFLLDSLSWDDQAEIKILYDQLSDKMKRITQMLNPTLPGYEYQEWFADAYADWTGGYKNVVDPNLVSFIEKALRRSK